MPTTLAGGTGADYGTRRGALLLLGAAILGAACMPDPQAATAPAAPPVAAPAQPTPPARTAVLGATAQSDEEAMRAGIQELLDRQANARARADRDAFNATIDQRNLTWRRIQGDAFSADTARGPRPASTYRVTRLQLKESGYVKAWIDVVPPGESAATAQGVWVFRHSETGWLHTEILNEEIGARKLHETPHFTLSHYAWDDDVIERIAATAERAHAHVLAKTGLASSAKATVSVNPTYGSHSALRGFGTLALFLPGTGQILIRSLESYGAGMVTPGESQDDRLFVATAHEYAHLVSNEVISTARIPKWMVEGFAEYVAENLRGGSMVAAVRGNRTLTLAQTSEIIEWGEDPGRNFTGADIDRAYAHAAHATQYFMERFGQDVFFEVAKEFADSRQWEPALVKHTGLSTADLESAYLTWTRQRYGL
jgi:hypothetical protein